MRLVFLGSPTAAVPSLHALVQAGHEVVLVVTGADRRRGRGSAQSPTPVATAARELGLTTVHELDAVTQVNADLGVVVAYGAMIPTAVLDQLSMLNVHFSLLPRWRGAAPVQRAILAGDVETGVCVMGLEPTLDTGPLYARAATPIGEKNVVDLTNELALMGARLLGETLSSTPLSEPLPHEGEASYAKKMTAADCVLDPANTALQLSRIVRSGHGIARVGGRRLIVLSAVATDLLLEQGRVQSQHNGVLLGTSEGSLLLHDVRGEGSRTMSSRDWIRGVANSADEMTWSRDESLRP